jgi:hypothetical protein
VLPFLQTSNLARLWKVRSHSFPAADGTKPGSEQEGPFSFHIAVNDRLANPIIQRPLRRGISGLAVLQLVQCLQPIGVL